MRCPGSTRMARLRCWGRSRERGVDDANPGVTCAVRVLVGRGHLGRGLARAAAVVWRCACVRGHSAPERARRPRSTETDDSRSRRHVLRACARTPRSTKMGREEGPKARNQALRPES